MGKLLCDSTAFQTSSPAVHWRGTETAVDVFDQKVVASLSTWNDVIGLEDQQRRRLQRIEAKGVLWTCPPRNSDSSSDSDSDTSASSSTDRSIVFRLSHGGNVLADGNCLFTASQRAMMARDIDAKELRSRTVRKFLEDFGSASSKEQEVINDAIRHMYSPDLKNGWGIHLVQEVKLLAPKKDRISLALAIEELVQLGMQRELAAEAIYKERCIAVTDGPSWAKYMGISGSSDDEYDIVTLQYTENGLLSVDENIEGRAAAFGDDIAIECMATEFKREIYVVQAHGSDAMVDEDNCVFFLPHRPRSEISELPFFLFMKGSGWCGAGADHYEPLIANPSPPNTHEKVAVVL